jgi:hypothetical protein
MRLFPLATGVLAGFPLLFAPFVLAQGGQAVPSHVADQQIQELALRWAFVSHATDLQQPAAYCVAFLAGDPSARPPVVAQLTDPPADFLQRFAEHSPPVRPDSACENITHPRHSVIYKPTGGRALHFTVGAVVEHADGTATIEVSYRQGGRWGRGWICTALQEEEKWTFSGCRVTWTA